MGKRVLAFLLAAAVTYVLACIALTQAVLAYLTSLGRDISAGEYFAAIGHDLIGYLGVYGPILLITLLIGYGVVALIVSRWPGLRLFGYVIGGFSAMVAVHLVLQAVFGMAPVWGAKSAFGILLQGLAGAVGGYLFARIHNPARA